MQTTLQQFTLSLLAYKGALVDAGDRSASVLLGSELAAALGMNDYERLVFDLSLVEPGALSVDYDAPPFEAMGRIVGSMGRIAGVSIPSPELRTIDPEKELERTLRLQNGVFRFRDCVQVTQLYFCFFLQYDVMADERSGGMEEVWVNPATRSMPQIGSLLETMESRDAAPPPELASLVSRAWDLARANAAISIRSRLGGFLESLKRRRGRDLQRMRDYYQTVDEEIRRKIVRVASREDARKGEIERLAATARAYEARAAELLERYRVRVRVTGLAALACAIPTYQIRVQLLRRSASTEASFSWNPFNRRIEPRCCDACRRATESAALCDDHVHYLCLDCLAPCPVCSKLFCRACHSRCPRAHQI
jgi:hypothetical protein